jgi:hypothetical protein
MVEHIIHRHGNLFAYLLEKFEVPLTIGVQSQAGKSHGPEPPNGRRQRHDAERPGAVLPHPLRDLRPASLCIQVRDEQRSLRPPDESGRCVVNRIFMAADEIGRHVGLDGLQAHRVPRLVVQGKRDEIHVDDPRKATGEFPEEPVQVAMRGDGLRDLQERSMSRGDIRFQYGFLIHWGSLVSRLSDRVGNVKPTMKAGG